MLGSIDIVAFVPTKDAEKARAFYVGVLGLRFVKDDGFALVLDANGIKVRVAKAQFTPAPDVYKRQEPTRATGMYCRC